MLRLRVNGWSMLPSIRPGDTLLIEAVDYAEVASGEVVLFLREQRLFAHRAVGRKHADLRIITRGDAMRTDDRPLSEAELLGKVTLIWRGGKAIGAPRKPGTMERAVAAVVRRFELAARLVVRVHGLIQSQQAQTV
jgi:signal peptidase I